MLRAAAAATLLAAFAIFSTWPALPHLGGDFLFVNDAFISAWDLWWVPHALASGENPYFTREILAPDGSYLAFHALIPLAGVVMAPVTWLLGPGLSLNLLKLLLPIAATLSARLLARTAGLSGAAAWVAGGLYGFSTIVGWRTLLHLNFGFPLAILPLAPVFALRYERSRSVRDGLLMGAMAGLCLLADPTIALFAVLTVVAYAVVALAAAREWRLWLRGAALAAAATLAVGLPQLAMMARAATNGGYKPNYDVLASTWVGADVSLLTMGSPGAVRGWFPGRLEDLAFRHPWGEATPVFGWGALGLALAALVLLVVARARPPVAGRFLAWGALLFAAAAVFALGPELTVADSAHVPLPIERHGERLSALMPYTWMTYLPFFADVRVPARFTMLGMLPLAMLGGVGFALLRARGRIALALAGGLLAFAVVESGFPDGGAAREWVPMQRERLYAPVKADRSDSIVVDVPLGFIGATEGVGGAPGGNIEPMLRATQHGHPVASGYVTRLTRAKVDELLRHRFYADLIALQNPDTPAPAVDAPAGAEDARRSDVGWVVVWPDAHRRVLLFLTRTGFERAGEEDGILLYRRAAKKTH